MPWWLKRARLGLRAPVERFAVRLLALGAGLITVFLVTSLVLSLVFFILAPLRERGLDARWAETLTDPQAIQSRFPPLGTNRAALELEKAAARFGLDLVPLGAERSFEVVDPLPGLPELRAWSDRVAAGRAEGLIAPPETAASVLAARSRAVERMVGIILAGETPRWEQNLGAAGGSGNSNLTALASLHRWLAAAAVQLLRAGAAAAADDDDAAEIAVAAEDAAERVLVASWMLNDETLRRSELSSRVAAFEVQRLQLAVLRHLRSPASHWPTSLGALDPVGSFREAVLLDSLAARASARRGEVFDADSGWGVARRLLFLPLVRWAMADGAEAQRRGLEALDEADVADFDPDALYVDLHEQIPRWNVMARTALPNLWYVWPQAVELRLEAELTAAVTRIRLMGRAERQELMGRLPLEEPAAVAGAAWHWSEEEGAVRVRLDGYETVLEHLVPAP